MLVLLFGFLKFIFKFGVYVFWQKVSISYTNYVGIVGTYGIQCPEMCISQRPCFHLCLALSVPIYKKFQTNINNKHITAVIIEENWEETICYLEILSTVRM